MERWEALAERFRSASREHSSIRERCEREAVEWRWATGRLYSLRPLEFDRSEGPKRGRWLKKPPTLGPTRGTNRCEYGIDAEGRPTVEREQFGGKPGNFVPRFFLYEEDYAEELHFDGARWPQVQKYTRAEYREGMPVSAAWYSGFQRGFEDYTYQDGRVVRIDSTWSNQPFTPNRLLIARYDAEYDERGELVLLTVAYEKTLGHPGGTFTCLRGKTKPAAV